MLYMLPIAVLQEVKLINGDFQCATNWFKLADPLLSFKAFSLCVLVSFYLIPLAVMAVLYALIAHRLWFSRIPVENAQDETNRRIQNKKRKVPRMKTPTNMMFVNMALFDIIVAVTMMPYMISFILYPFRWLGGLFGTITCKLTYYAFYISIAGSILALTVMATDRFFAIVLPFKKRESRVDIEAQSTWKRVNK
ncbi:predicted protein [Nematostella vectensis]|uniref:G-protein coupled receptors family 1 profile domain-containing protein n=1 Tax=Nematostella vectensis TaxID=45351 RepID=A7T4R1_NEMVE|nr:predicted protein [Nematostella vectensis]|eukprot:XP_001621152.1 hypothetical protein NEMVEDRAFT_v1g222314 [Nematostella vectensis]